MKMPLRNLGQDKGTKRCQPILDSLLVPVSSMPLSIFGHDIETKRCQSSLDSFLVSVTNESLCLHRALFRPSFLRGTSAEISKLHPGFV